MSGAKSVALVVVSVLIANLIGWGGTLLIPRNDPDGAYVLGVYIGIAICFGPALVGLGFARSMPRREARQDDPGADRNRAGHVDVL